MKSMTRWQLASLLMTAGQATVTLPDGTSGTLQSVQREDGSGRVWEEQVVGGPLRFVLKVHSNHSVTFRVLAPGEAAPAPVGQDDPRRRGRGR